MPKAPLGDTKSRILNDKYRAKQQLKDTSGFTFNELAKAMRRRL